VARAIPSSIVLGDHVDVDLGVLKTGKEAEISVVERTGLDGRSCLLALKRYRPRTISHKGELQELGFERAPTFRNDIVYRDGRKVTRNSREQRAMETQTKYGKELLKGKWLGHEYDVMRRLWDAGVDVPYPVENRADGLLMEYIGAATGAAPRLAQARLGRADTAAAYEQLLVNLRTMLEVGIVHSDLSAYNLLWWEGRLWLIDFPQAVDIAFSPHGLDFLHRDIANVAKWFNHHGVEVDGEELFAELLSVTFPMR
jgi:RIO kinase 1